MSTTSRKFRDLSATHTRACHSQRLASGARHHAVALGVDAATTCRQSAEAAWESLRSATKHANDSQPSKFVGVTMPSNAASVFVLFLQVPDVQPEPVPKCAACCLSQYCRETSRCSHPDRVRSRRC